MNLISFISLVELRTKVASLLPFLFGSLYAFYAFDSFNLFHAVVLFFSMILIDMTTTALNNYMDYKKALLKEGYGYEIHNAIAHYDLNPVCVKRMIILMFIVASALGLYLAYLTNIVILLLGIVCFAIGILYTYGPVPISRTPFGELFSGVTMGLMLTFISIYIHIFNKNLLTLQVRAQQLLIYIDYYSLIGIILISMPFVLAISNIMLANNLCDIDEDLVNKRFTLPIYIGQKVALILWELSYYIAYIFIVFAIVLGYLPIICIASLVTLIPVKHHIDYFKLKQVKKETFKYAVQNFLLIATGLIVTLGFDLLVHHYFF